MTPQRIGFLLNRAVNFQRAGDVDAAVADYDRILAQQPDHVAALPNLGILRAADGEPAEAERLYQRVLEISPGDADTLTNLANLNASRGDLAGAERNYRAALTINPALPAALANFAELLSRPGRHRPSSRFLCQGPCGRPHLAGGPGAHGVPAAGGRPRCKGANNAGEILEDHPSEASAWCLMGDYYGDAGNDQAAEEAHRKAAALRPTWARPLQQIAMLAAGRGDLPRAVTVALRAMAREPKNASVLRDVGFIMTRLDELSKARQLLEKSWAIDPTDWQTAHHLGNLHYVAGQPAAALKFFERADDLNPNSYEILLDIALCRQQLGELDRSEAELRALVVDHPNRAEVHKALGLVFYSRNIFSAAVAQYEVALEIDPDDLETTVQLAAAHMENSANELAVELTEKALAISPGMGFAHRVQAQALSNINRMKEAVAAVRGAADLAGPQDIGTLMTMAGIFERAGKRPESLETYRLIVKLDPDNSFAGTRTVDLQLTLCDWRNYDDFVDGVLRSIAAAVETHQPLNLCVQDLQNLPIAWSALASAAVRSAEMAEEQVSGLRKRTTFKFDQRLSQWRAGERRRVRLGWALPYTFFHSFPMLLKSVIERLDREQFEVFGYSIRPGDTDFDRLYRGTFDHFRDIPAASPEISGQQIYDDEIDVLIDVTGHTSINCQAVMAMRAAPVQAHMLGYSITTGSEYIKYLVTDPVWMQPRYREHCTETMVYLPDTWFVGYRPEISPQTYTRAELNLPEDGFVFCSFNQPFKFEPSMFDIWMRMLKRVPGSVLWLGAWDVSTRDNLMREALARDVDPERLIFADLYGHAAHLSRLRQADLLLDTRFHGGGATTIDALWAGVPILTLRGDLPTSGNGTHHGARHRRPRNGRGLPGGIRRNRCRLGDGPWASRHLARRRRQDTG